MNTYKKEAMNYIAKARKNKENLSEVVKNLNSAIRVYQFALPKAETDNEENYINEQIKELRAERRNLESITGNKFYAFFSLASLFSALIFLSSSMTGNVVGESILKDSTWLGICFFLCGLTFTFFYLKRKK